jgi:hypothetical protein
MSDVRLIFCVLRRHVAQTTCAYLFWPTSGARHPCMWYCMSINLFGRCMSLFTLSFSSGDASETNLCTSIGRCYRVRNRLASTFPRYQHAHHLAILIESKLAKQQNKGASKLLKKGRLVLQHAQEIAMDTRCLILLLLLLLHLEFHIICYHD